VGNKKWIQLLLSTAVASALVGCGGGSSTAVQNPPAPPKTKVAIGFQPAPTQSIFVNGSATLTAVVKNDSSNAGVDWFLPCPIGNNCGQLSPLHTESAKSVTYTPPPSIPGNSQTFTIEAFATIDHSSNILTPITVNGFAGGFKGTYVLQTFGVDQDPITGNFGNYQFAAAVVLDGNGKITSGEQTYSNTSRSVSDTITGGSYYLGADGRGTLTLNTADQNLGQQGEEFFSVAFLSSSQAFIAKIDDPVNTQFASNETSSGTMDLQTSKPALTGGYAFAVNGSDILLEAMAVGGVMNIDSPNTISGPGSVADQDLVGTLTARAQLSGTVSNPDAFGRVQFDLTTDFGSMQFMGYIVDGVHIKLVESDNGTGAGFGSTGGLAIAQGSATGTFKDNTAFSGTYVFGISGEDLTSTATFGSLASAGVFTADGSGKLTDGFNDKFVGYVGVTTSDSFTGKYKVDATGTGRVNSTIKFPHPRLEPGANFTFYLTGNGNPPLILDADGDLINFGPVGLGTGVAYPQPAPSTAFSGKYGLSFTQNNSGSEDDASGLMNVDGTTKTLAGIADTNAFFVTGFDTALTGTFQSSQLSPSNRLPGITSNQYFTLDLPMAYYIIDANHGLFVETDTVDSGTVTLGYFATRNPVCPTCP
jgi:hypothetical protein